MLGKATLAVSGLVLSLFAASPAAAQTAPAADDCRFEASLGTGAVTRLSGRANRFCNAPGGIALLGGRLAHAIMFVDLGPHIAAIPTPVATPADGARPADVRRATLPRVEARPAFATPVVER
jgi:hypothetical protein